MRTKLKAMTNFMESFQKSEKVPELSFVHLVPEVWDVLGKLPRTGWVTRGVLSPESVQDHIVTLRTIAASVEGLTDAEKDGLLDMLEVHDWPEAIHGDEVILTEDPVERKKLKDAKFKRENGAMEEICEPLGEAGKKILALWLRFETSQDAGASFGRQLDKYQAMEKSLEYEKEQGIPLFQTFLYYSEKYVTHPILRQKLEQLKREWLSLGK